MLFPFTCGFSCINLITRHLNYRALTRTWVTNCTLQKRKGGEKERKKSKHSSWHIFFWARPNKGKRKLCDAMLDCWSCYGLWQVLVFSVEPRIWMALCLFFSRQLSPMPTWWRYTPCLRTQEGALAQTHARTSRAGTARAVAVHRGTDGGEIESHTITADE